MKKSTVYTIIRIIATIAAIIVLSCSCFFLIIFFGLGQEDFYMCLVAACYFLLLALIPVSIFRVFRFRTTRRLWLLLLGIIILSIATKESIRAYHNSFERIDYDVNLITYEPFRENTRAVDLDTVSVLKLDTLLPRLDGATSFYPVYAAFVRAVYPPGDYSYIYSTVVCNTTPGAYNALIEGNADIIFVLHPSKQQLEYAQECNVEMKLTPIGREAFVFFVNSKNPVNNLSTTQLKGIYSGKIENWRDVDGKNSTIKAFQRNENSGSQTAFLQFMEGTEVMEAQQTHIIHGMGPIIQRAADYKNYPSAIGYSFRFYVDKMVGNGDIKLLSVDGIYPDKQTIEDGSYPLVADFYAITRANETNPHVQQLLDWILSEQGQSLVEKTGYNRIE
ncbi:PstS family phosphate ABC transporter substrate-binding protein [Bacteroides sp. 519]|uniref:PstS family phosphate ABC transporter substrate-binding protein n=1 Tax=Bacteroides sp. 519 TaxID=2302937 RepID=UPI0013D4C957|nr:substrate-binding domain-containing protein [Bacteroides sp. 519]